jgi:hypothetical protein
VYLVSSFVAIEEVKEDKIALKNDLVSSLDAFNELINLFRINI